MQDGSGAYPGMPRGVKVGGLVALAVLVVAVVLALRALGRHRRNAGRA